MPYTEESYKKRMLHTGEYYERKAKRNWAEAKNGGPADGYKFQVAHDFYEKAKRCYEKSGN